MRLLFLILPLLAFTITACRIAPVQPAHAASFNVAAFGALGDGKTLNTREIQATIDACASKGGGTVVIPAGEFLSGAIFLKPGVNLRLEKGAILKGSNNIRDYPIAETRIEGHTDQWAAALVNATGVDGLRITGEGIIDGNGLTYWQAFWARRRENPKCTNLEVVRPRLMFIRYSHDVKVSGIELRNSGFWTLHLYQCEQALVENVRITAPDEPVKAPSSDGIDIDCCNHVTVRGCYIAVDDDCVCLKSGKGLKAHLENRPVENILVEDCEFGHGHGVLTLGSEATIARNVTVRNCRVTGANHLVRFKLRPDTRQLYEHITFDGIQMSGAGSEVFDIRPWTQFYDPKGGPPESAVIRDITVRNITVKNAADVGELRGNPHDTMQDFRFENIAIEAKNGRWPANSVNGFVIQNVIVNGVEMQGNPAGR